MIVYDQWIIENEGSCAIQICILMHFQSIQIVNRSAHLIAFRQTCCMNVFVKECDIDLNTMENNSMYVNFLY